LKTTDTIEGRNPVLEALKSGRTLNKILLARNIGRHSVIAEILHLAQTKQIPVEFIPREALDREGVSGAHQGVIAYIAARDYVSLEDLFTISRQKNEPPLYCILDGMEDPHNLGAIIRTADASGIHGIIIRSRREVGLTATVAKVSAGAIEYIPVARVTNIGETINTLKKEDIWIIGIDAAGAVNYQSVDFRLPSAIVIGGEGKGLSDLVKKKSDLLASIPMRGTINSLNASVAAALVMYEAFHQRTNTLK
jgi:23S rRNA (guanosine2251-2'-O)-methyltransferase